MDAPKAQVIAPPKQPTRQDSKSPDSSATIDRVQQAQNSMSGVLQIRFIPMLKA